MSDSYEYVTLSSINSKHLFPENTMSNFRVKLGWRMQRKGTWEVACVRFSFTNSLCTFNKPQSIVIREVGKEDGAELMLAPQRFKSIAHLIRVINETLKQEVSVGKTDRLPLLRLDRHDRLRCFPGLINNKQHEMLVSEGLQLILGIEREGFHYLDAFKTDLYLYIDCVKNSIVGDASVPLLTTIDIGNMNMKNGEQTIVKIKQPEYVPLSHSDINNIEVQLLDDTGSPPVFDYGTVSLTLHFREK